MSSRVIQMFACISCIFCMLSSATYHLYNSMSRSHYQALLKLDLIGIGFKITGLAVSLIYTGFHNYKGVGYPLALVLGLMMTSNLLLQMTPCYMQEKYSSLRTLFFVVLIIALLVVALTWCLSIATIIELELFLIRLALSFVYVGIGFFFWASGFPEKVSKNYWL